ncbi:TetR/AcrR family transcriptional regulator [Agromyces sp. SYSU K20354]|uniref:TetR/AcrR family transcriptional regulator n=1 Tax=Agromyces cavernae TaxID=2898659 RepID=UPI001E403C37|nr:TetR/AcrR family transcriptional regulator [Agromyces cavernae]MCD2442902.1 TetR/AcrR family transcriptional regulator [Agromyces cavernae]
MKTRSYTMSTRAHSVRATGERILKAALARFSTDYYDDVTLDAIAADAGVTVQTVMRRFGSKEGLARTLTESTVASVTAQRAEAPAGDVAGAIANLIEHYEQVGDLAMLLLRQEERVPPIAETTTIGKRVHLDWVTRVFAPWLDEMSNPGRELLHAQLTATCDVYTWYLLRRQAGLSRDRTQQALTELVKGVLP